MNLERGPILQVTIYSIRDPMKNDLEKSILGALMKALQNKSEPSVDELMSQLQLAVKWNRSDTAAKYILNKNRQNLWPVSIKCLTSILKY